LLGKSNNDKSQSKELNKDKDSSLSIDANKLHNDDSRKFF